MRNLLSIFLLALLCYASAHLSAQQDSVESTRSDYRVIVQVQAGISNSRIDRTIKPEKSEYTTTGLSGTIRLLWRPDHLLGIGMETGFIRISKLLIKEDNKLPPQSVVRLGAVPVLGVFSMEKYGVELSAGVGLYNYQVDAIVGDDTPSSDQWEIGWMASVGYMYPLSRSWLVGADVRHYAIPERSVGGISANLRLQWQWWY